MDWIWISIIANSALALSAVLDKMLLSRGIKDPLVYAFWSIVSTAFVLMILPFRSVAVSFEVFLLSLATGIAWFAATFFFFSALSRGEASTALPLIGALAPVATLGASVAFFAGAMSFSDYVGFLFLVIGGFIFFRAEDSRVRMPVLVLALLSALCFGIANTLLARVFSESSFLAGIFWTRLGGVFSAGMLLFFPQIRSRIFSSSSGRQSPDWLRYWANRIFAACAMLVGLYPFALAHPALVDAANGFKYAAIVMLGWAMLGERFRGKILLLKLTASILVFTGIVWLGVSEYAARIPVDAGRPIFWGVTFSQKFSRALGLDWHENFDTIMRDLKPRRIRLVAYWDEIEKEKGVYDFSDTDWLLEHSRGSGADIILTIGLRVPRWPECHMPKWIGRDFPDSSRIFPSEAEEALSSYIRTAITRYAHNPEIKMWQVENEPYLVFGLCPTRANGALEREVALVKSIDQARPVLVTDGGEFGDWYRAANAGDVFGTTMYRRVYSTHIGPYIGPMEYPLAPSYFRLKNAVMHRLIGDTEKKFIVVELQGEPWGEVELPILPFAEQKKLFPIAYFRDTIRYAKETGFGEYYLWGAEWWYWMKTAKGDSDFWDEMRKIIAAPALEH